MIQEISKYNGLKYTDSIKRKYKRKSNNCYTYAINQPKNPYTGKHYEDYDYCQPGFLGGKGRDSFIDYYDLNKTGKEIINSARRDLRCLGYKLLKTTYKKYIEDKNCWKVALCLANDDYHWFRQNDDGTWSHKRGAYEITNRDSSRKIIYNPETCNRGDYATFVGFYLIEKIEGVENKCA